MTTSRWFRPCGGSPTPSVRLICFPYAGAGASIYREWRLPDDIDADVWAVQLPGRENRWTEPPSRQLDTIVTALAAEVRPLLHTPFAFFGHSMGALLAFELARALRDAREPLPTRLFLSAHRAPDLPPWRPAVSTLAIQDLLKRLRELTGPARSIVDNEDILLTLAPMMRADFAACEAYQYQPEPPLDVPFTCFGAIDDPEVRFDEVEAWSQHTSADCRIHPFTGGHLFLGDRRTEVLGHIADALAMHPDVRYGGMPW